MKLCVVHFSNYFVIFILIGLDSTSRECVYIRT